LDFRIVIGAIGNLLPSLLDYDQEHQPSPRLRLGAQAGEEHIDAS
jgi:hypothetical protein